MGLSFSSTARREVDGAGSMDQALTLFSHDGIMSRQLELPRNPHSLISSMPEQPGVLLSSYWLALAWHMSKQMLIVLNLSSEAFTIAEPLIL
jgi:hypothetical protein